MDLPTDRRALVKTIVFNVPVTVLAIAAVSWALAAWGVRFESLFRVGFLNPFVYVASMVFHYGWGHFLGNLWLWLPFGFALTWLTSNRHVLGVAVLSNALAMVVGMAIGQYHVGLSVAVLAVGAATLVRASGYAMQDASSAGIQVVMLGVVGPLLVGLLLVAIVAGGNSWIAHFSHFFGFLFGAGIEAMYVFSAAKPEDEGRQIPEQFGG